MIWEAAAAELVHALGGGWNVSELPGASSVTTKGAFTEVSNTLSKLLKWPTDAEPRLLVGRAPKQAAVPKNN